MRAHGAATETRFLQAYAQGRQERRCRATQTARTITSQLGHVWGRSNVGRDEMATGCTRVATKVLAGGATQRRDHYEALAATPRRPLCVQGGIVLQDFRSGAQSRRSEDHGTEKLFGLP